MLFPFRYESAPTSLQIPFVATPCVSDVAWITWNVSVGKGLKECRHWRRQKDRPIRKALKHVKKASFRLQIRDYSFCYRYVLKFIWLRNSTSGKHWNVHETQMKCDVCMYVGMCVYPMKSRQVQVKFVKTLLLSRLIVDLIYFIYFIVNWLIFHRSIYCFTNWVFGWFICNSVLINLFDCLL